MLALVIGNSEYQGISSLTNAGRDAQLISSTLAEIGVDSAITRFDLTRAEMSRTVNEFFRAMSRYDVGFVYYAGHGMQDEYGENYLVPVDFGTESSSDLYSEGFDTERIFRGCSRLRDKAFVFFLDACRNNPYPSDYRSSGSGLGEPEVPSEGVLVGFSTESGKVAGDYAEQSNGHYASALSEMLKVPNMKAEDILKEVGTIVRDKSDRKQSPEWWGNLSGSVIFNFDAEQYEVQISQLQEVIINDVNSYFKSTNPCSKYHVDEEFTLPPQYFGLGSKLRSFSEEHASRGQMKLARQAELYALIVDWHWFNIHGEIFPDSKLTIEFLRQSNKKSIFDENPALSEVFRIKSKVDLEVFLAFASIRLYPDHPDSGAFVKVLNDNLWLEDDLTWAVGASCLGYSIAQINSSSALSMLPESHHIEIEADTISYLISKAYPKLSGLYVGQRVKNVVIDGDTITEIPDHIISPITVVLEGEESEFTLMPNPGFVLRDSIFIPTRSREDYLRRYGKASERLAYAEIEEWRSADLQGEKFHDLLPYQAVYITQFNWYRAIQNQCHGGDPEVSEILWSNFMNELSLFSEYRQLGGELLSGLWMLLFERFDHSCNQLLFLDEDFMQKKSREIEKGLFGGAKFLSQLHTELGDYSGEYNIELDGWGEAKLALGGTMWALAAGLERTALFSKSPESCVSAATSLSQLANKRSIDENTSPSTYLVDYANYISYLSSRELSSGSDEAIENVTVFLQELVYVFAPYPDDETERTIDHPLFAKGRYDLLVTKDPRMLTDFFRAFGNWAKIYVPGYYRPVQYTFNILDRVDFSKWIEIEKKEVLVSIGAVVDNWQAQSNQYWAKKGSIDVLADREKEITRLINRIKNGSDIELEWYDNFQRNYNVLLDIVGAEEK